MSRRAFARISIIVRFGESSMNSGASDTSPILRASLAQSSSLILPLRMWCSGTFASADKSRMVISVRLISSEKMHDVNPCLIDADRARSKPSVLFPIAGRAATMIIWPGCRPLVSSSRSVKPVGTPTIASPRESIASISSRVDSMMSFSGA